MNRPAPLVQRRRAFVFFAVLFLTTGARASNSITAEIGGGQSKPTPTIASAPFEYQKLSGRWQATDTLSIASSLRLTHDFAGAPVDGTVLRTASDWVWQGTLGASFDASEHVALGLDVSGSPTSRRDVASALSYAGAAGSTSTLDASMKTNGWNAGAAFDVQYDTFDEDEEHAVDATFDVGAGYTHYASDQTLAAVEEPGGVVQVETLASRCTNVTTPQCQAYAAAGKDKASRLEQARLGATVTFTLWDRTEVGLDVGYYLYDRGKPGEAGFFDAPIDRGAREVGSATWGAGMPLLPPRWTMRPELGHRWDWITVRAYYQFGKYAVEPSEVGHTVGGKITLLLDRWRPYVTGNVREDVAGGAAGASSWTVGAGIQRLF